MKGGYGTPIQRHCDLCLGPLSHREMVNPVWLSTDWKYVCANCFGKVVDSWAKDPLDTQIPNRPEVSE